jgi:hypothetical protein
MDPAATARAKKWDKAEHTTFKMLVKKGLIDPNKTTEHTRKRSARSIGGIGRKKRFTRIGRPPLLNFVLQSLKTAPEQGVRLQNNKDGYKDEEGESSCCFVLAHSSQTPNFGWY